MTPAPAARPGAPEPGPVPALPVQPGAGHPLDPDDAEVLRRELALLKPSVRADRDAVLALLHPDFTEVGASGRVWTRDGIADALAAQTHTPDGAAVAGSTPDGAAVPGPGPDDLVGRVTELTCARLAPDVVQLTYALQEPDRLTLRSSVWVRDAGGAWLLRFHQGTLTP